MRHAAGHAKMSACGLACLLAACGGEPQGAGGAPWATRQEMTAVPAAPVAAARTPSTAEQLRDTADVRAVHDGAGCAPDTAPLPTRAPVVKTDPEAATVEVGREAVFTVDASGDGPLRYQWFRNGSPIAAATASRYIAPPATPADDGAEFSVSVGNALGEVHSDAAVLSVEDPATQTPGEPVAPEPDAAADEVLPPPVQHGPVSGDGQA